MTVVGWLWQFNPAWINAWRSTWIDAWRSTWIDAPKLVSNNMDILLARFLSPPRMIIMRQFLRFGVVGLVGLAFDAGTIYASKAWIGLYVAGVLGYVIAATVNWWLNRQWTFRGQRGDGGLLRQWAAFMSANFVGFIINRGVYMLLITVSTYCAEHPIIPVMVGIPAAMIFNFILSRQVVFRAQTPR